MHSAALQISDETPKPRTSASKPRFSIFSPPCLARAQDLEHRFAGNGASHCLRMTWQFDVLDRATSASITYFLEQRQTASHFTDISCQEGLFVMPGRCACQVNSKLSGSFDISTSPRCVSPVLVRAGWVSRAVGAALL
ncbi:unnamed protein product [Effrenium voratum]|nr:unnamed protein product [Effrenium voratum]